MGRITRRAMLAGMAGLGLAGCAGTRPELGASRVNPAELILCGADEVFILSMAMASQSAPEKVWSWRAADCAEIPELMKRRFRSTDDCKPVDGGRKVLISSSSGAVALVERQSGRALFHALVVNAHSVEMLPGGQIAAASSVGTAPGSNRVILFDAGTGREIASDPMVSAHGLVWDQKRSVLWALGGNELRMYQVGSGTGGAGALKIQSTIKLPEGGGHDLTAIPGSASLFISTERGCWSFDRDTQQLSPHEILGQMPRVKSFSVHPGTGRIAYVQAEGEDWWAQNVHLLRPDGVLNLPGQRLYKARWVA